ncbi:PepSY-associated TM helix domain-containing protein [Methylobacterium sp. Leaf100]|uniref:PepSY-associated TM helix domain-containing protein n=1 Tax=Methylobacterium sp. Leaf100 TaxID=1736252 RepID=UPI0006F432CC|nr:PepSY-associated TM helix domain-containing protein [Methylobacterium sp. Leaf100]KQP31976.1 peptidase [Methylobacterium sp. Leaf100]USU30631.1 PepSY domain-containing protein [Methylobacterium sp. OTU13CASTA1]
MVRTILFRLHWALGLTAGLVLVVLGVTGALMSYEEAIGEWADRDRASMPVQDAVRLGPEAMVARLQAQRPGARVSTLTLSGDPERTPRARFSTDAKTGARPPSAYLDPYDGRDLGPPRLESAFATIRDLHRWLLVPGDGKGWGRSVTGASTIALLVFLATGLYLRWPQIHSWRVWLRPRLARPGRARWWSLHTIAGTWLLPAYALIALSGLWWSYDGYRTVATWALTGEAPRTRPGRMPGRSGPAEPLALDRAWAAFQAGEGAGATLAIVTLPAADATAIRIRYLTRDAPDSRARNDITFDAATGAQASVSRDADKPLGQRMADNMLEVHRGRFFGGIVAFVFFAASLLMPVLAVSGLVLYALRRRSARRRATSASPGLETARPLKV